MVLVSPPSANLSRSATVARPVVPGRPVDLVAVAHGLVDVARDWPGAVDPPQRCWQLLAAGPGLEAWAIAWPVGGAIELHDHGGSAGALLVVTGELVETAVEAADDVGHRAGGDPVLRVRTVGTGRAVEFDGTHVHDVLNVGPRPALSIHVYRPRLTSMTYFELHDGALRPGRTEHFGRGTVTP